MLPTLTADSPEGAVSTMQSSMRHGSSRAIQSRDRAVITILLLGLLGTIPARAQTPSYPDHAKLMVWRDAEGQEHPVRSAQDWAKRRAHILAHMQEVMGPLPDASRKVPLDPKVIEEVRFDTHTRRKLTIAVEPGDRLACYLLIPRDVNPKSAAV